MAYFETTRTLYYPEPDYARPLPEIPQEVRDSILRRLRILYSDPVAQAAQGEIERILRAFLDSHDGIGLLGARNILSKEELDRLCRRVESHGGLISYKTARDGGVVPYELNITWYSALNKKQDGDPLRIQIRRFIASRAIALVLRGVPGIYLHSLFGTHNDHAAVEATRENRVINRSIVDCRSIMRSMRHPRSKKYRINQMLGKMIHVRTRNRAFHPNGPQQILSLSASVFAVKRTSPEGDRCVIALINVSQSGQRIQIPLAEMRESERIWQDTLSGRKYLVKKYMLEIVLRPYDVLWLSPSSQ